MDAKLLADALRQLVDDWQTTRNLAAIDAASCNQFAAALAKPDCADPEYCRELRDDANQRVLMYSTAAQATRWKIIEVADQLIGTLGNAAPRSLIDFGIHLQPHGDEAKALAVWPTVRGDLQALAPVGPTKQVEAPPQEFKALHRALAILADPKIAHFKIKVAEIAKMVDVSPQYLYDNPIFSASWKAFKDSNKKRPVIRRGTKEKDGTIEAVDEDF